MTSASGIHLMDTLRRLLPGKRHLRLLPARSPGFRYTGRLDFRRADAVGFIWQASSVELAFSGDFLALGFAALKGQAFFNLELDGEFRVIEARNGWLNIAVQAGDHQVKLIKRSEALAGQVDFLGIKTSRLAEVHPVSIPHRPKYIFYGDSITAGACNEDLGEDQWLHRRSHNSTLSYAAITAAAMGADHHNIAVSGIGIVKGFEPYTAPQIWDRMHYHPAAPSAHLDDWPADIVFVLYGENDAAFTRNNQLPFPESFTDDYVALILRMRIAYPTAEFVLLRGGMAGGAASEELNLAWHSAVVQLETVDPRIHHLQFRHYAPHHPRVSDHHQLAAELTGWLRQYLPYKSERPQIG